MSTFLFVLGPEANSAQVFKMLNDLEDQFPKHDFAVGDARYTRYEKNVLALVEGVGGSLPAAADIAEVTSFFERKLRELLVWKPS